ncbi:hypothetical protein ACIHAR_02115 [Streptomyces sp. NPDC052016]|uniref:hypothetical protein n=1 Tax=unclassified Streptomyces TaxID=2593676 RepID=UPI003431F8C8
MFPGDREGAAEAILQAVSAQATAHRLVLGSDHAQRRIGTGVNLDQLRAEFEAGREPAFSTDFPGDADNAVL